MWVSNGAAPPGMQWVAYEFPHPVYVGSIHLKSEEDKPERSPSMIYVEASCEKYFKNFVTQWIINNPNQDADKRFNGKMLIRMRRMKLFAGENLVALKPQKSNSFYAWENIKYCI